MDQIYRWLISIVILYSTTICYQTLCYELVMENIKFLNATEVNGVYKLNTWRVKKINRTTPAMDMDLEIFVDIDDATSVRLF